MSYLVLARKFRPQTFASIVGQKYITKALANAILRNKVSHAFLFSGPRGVGKTTAARVLARALNCTGRELPESVEGVDENQARSLVEPCGECPNCIEIARSSSIAVWEIDGASNNSVENVRDLIDSLKSLPPPGSRYKIYIIDEVHMLSVAAFNALLKSLEEPPPNTIFVFATTEPHKIPETVVSRCQRHDFCRLSTAVIAERLREIAQHEGIDAEDEVFRFIARKAQGGMRDAQSMLDRLNAFSFETVELSTAQRIFGVIDRGFFFELSNAIFAQDSEQCFLLLDSAFSQSIDLRSFVGDFLEHWRNLLLLSLTKKENEEAVRGMLDFSSEEFSQAKVQLEKTSSFDLQRLFDLAQKTSDTALMSKFPRFVFEAGVSKMATMASLRPLPEIIEKLERIDSAKALVVDTPRLSSDLDHAPVKAVQPKKEIPKTISKEESLAPNTEQTSPDFNPSWQDFLNHVKGRSEHVLAAFLRRVVPKLFVVGKLEIEAEEFDFESLREQCNSGSLRDCLYSYSGHAKWDIRLLKHDSEQGEEESSGDAQRVPAKSGNGSVAIPGSLAEKEDRESREMVKKRESDARKHPLVKTALETFEGSEIEKVLVRKRD